MTSITTTPGLVLFGGTVIVLVTGLVCVPVPVRVIVVVMSSGGNKEVVLGTGGSTTSMTTVPGPVLSGGRVTVWVTIPV